MKKLVGIRLIFLRRFQMNKWKKKYKKLKKKYLKLNQGSLLYCKKCGWNTIIPYEDDVCLNCNYWEDKMKKKEAVDSAG